MQVLDAIKTRFSLTPAADPPLSSDVIRFWLRQHVGDILGINAQEIDPNQPLIDYGLGSLDAIRMTNDLERAVGRKLPPTLTWDHPTIDSVVAFVTERSSRSMKC